MHEYMTIKILNQSRNNLLIDFKFLTKAIYTLELKNHPFSVGTDGNFFYYQNRKVLENYLRDRSYPTSVFFHSLMHCVLKHPFIFDGENIYENLASDIIVESIIINIQRSKTSYKENRNKLNIINNIKDNVVAFVPRNVVEYLEGLNQNTIKHYQSIFSVDDHVFWRKEMSLVNYNNQVKDEKNKDEKRDNFNGIENGKNNQDDSQDNQKSSNNSPNKQQSNKGVKSDLVQSNSKHTDISKRWKDIGEELSMDLEIFSNNQGILAGDLIYNVLDLKREEEDYATFLKQFAVMGEVMRSNPDEFDILYYTYGLNLYKNVALVEPLEYRDEKRIKDFVIAVDTSGSVYGPLVERFLQKTYNILMNEESFHKKINLHIIQCDAEIQKVDIIKEKKDIDEYLKHLKLYGFGGTDFRPVFTYIEEKIKDGEFNNLQGIIYFTDGYGIFPTYRPRYKSAFIFMESFKIPEVPPWAIKHVIKADELE